MSPLVAALVTVATVATATPGLDRPDAEQVARVRAAVSETTANEQVHPVVTRTAGADRWETAAALSTFWTDVVWPRDDTLQRVVVVTNGEGFADSLAGGAFAGNLLGPVLLTKAAGLPSAIRAALADLQPDRVVVVGGTVAVSETVEAQLAGYVSDPSHVIRVDGANRYAVSAALASELGASDVAYVASGVEWPDGLAGGAAAGTEQAPLLLTKPDDVPSAVMTALREDVQPREIVLLGGTTGVSDAVLDELATVAPVSRVGGANRYATAAILAERLPTYYGATVASGLEWPDALVGSAYAAVLADKVLLLKPDGVPLASRSAVTELSLAWITALGGSLTLPEAVLDELRAMTVDLPVNP
ncbi:cell wall-binding repeat-containing protein [Ornithinimicrobium tianjinense]|nr:cell wall-binding repeat-containing protein [Ornithinimicrobium tianjinense]